MIAARRAALAATALTLGACGLEVGPTASWVDVATVDGPLTAKTGQPADGGPVAMARPTTLRIVTFNVEMGADATALGWITVPAVARCTVRATPELACYP